MTWQFSLYQLPSLTAAVVSLVVLEIAWSHRRTPIGKPFVVFMAGLFAWSLTYALQLGGSEISTQIVFDKLGYIGAVIVPAAWLILTARYAGRDTWLTRRRIQLFAIEPAITLVLVVTNSQHGLIYESVSMARNTVTPVLTTTFGPWYWLNLVYSYLLVVAGLVLVVDVFLTGSRLYRRQNGLLIMGAVIPLAANGLFAVGMSPIPSIDLTTFTFTITGMVFAVCLFQFDLLNRAPVARKRMNEALGDGLLVLDEENRIVDFDEMATRILNGELVTDRRIKDLFTHGDLDTLDGTEFSATIDGNTRFYHVQCFPLQDHRDESVGATVALRDITNRKAYEQRLEVANRLLRHNLRNEVNVISGHAEGLMKTLTGQPADRARIIQERSQRLTELSRKAEQLEAPLQQAFAEPVIVDAASVMTSIVGQFRDTHPDAVIHVSGASTAHVSTIDPDLFTVALENVLENAIVHADQDPEVTIHVDAGDPVRISVADNGPGIPSVEYEVLAEGRETPLQHGSGIGLWLVHWIVTSSGGQLSFTDNHPRGTVVSMTLPAA